MSVLPFIPGYKIERPLACVEEVFLEHYDWMFQSAMQLTRGRRESAEDLVHDAFVQFQLRQQSIEAIEDLRAYLYGMLRNLYISQVRRVSRYPIQPLSILDHDSVSAGLRAYDCTDQLYAMSQLMRACDYARHQKESSVSAGIFILRYFHGYYPVEIAHLLRTKPDHVDQWLAHGRAEAKAYLAGELAFSRIRNIPKIRASRVTVGRAVFLSRLRAAIFESCTSPCEMTDDRAVELTPCKSTLAHLVSCASCLDQRSREAGLPGPGERTPKDAHQRNGNRDESGEDSPASHGNSIRGINSGKKNRKERKGARRRSGYARTQEVLRHRPTEISVAVEGDVRTSHIIQSAVTLLNLALDSKEQAEFVEILSGHGVRFLLLDRQDLTSDSTRHYRIELSDDRFLEAKVIPCIQGQCVQIEYCDPAFEVQSASLGDSSMGVPSI